MMGTLAMVMAKKSIRTHKEVYRADVKGDIEAVNGILKITRIQVNYELKIPEDKRNDAREAFDNYFSECKRHNNNDLYGDGTAGIKIANIVESIVHENTGN